MTQYGRRKLRLAGEAIANRGHSIVFSSMHGRASHRPLLSGKSVFIVDMHDIDSVQVALKPHSAQKIVTYFPAFFDELHYVLPHCSIYSYYNSYLYGSVLGPHVDFFPFFRLLSRYYRVKSRYYRVKSRNYRDVYLDNIDLKVDIINFYLDNIDFYLDNSDF